MGKQPFLWIDFALFQQCLHFLHHVFRLPLVIPVNGHDAAIGANEHRAEVMADEAVFIGPKIRTEGEGEAADGGEFSGSELPVSRISPVKPTVFGKGFRGIVFRIDGEAEKSPVFRCGRLGEQGGLHGFEFRGQ